MQLFNVKTIQSNAIRTLFEVLKDVLTASNAIKLSDINIDSLEDIDTIYNTINILEINEITPYYLGFKGSIVKAEKNSYISHGIYRWIDDATVEITELPIGTWTEDYKEFLENMITNNLNNLKYIENHYTSKNVKFILHFNTNVRQNIEKNFDVLFKFIFCFKLP